MHAARYILAALGAGSSRGALASPFGLTHAVHVVQQRHYGGLVVRLDLLLDALR